MHPRISFLFYIINKDPLHFGIHVFYHQYKKIQITLSTTVAGPYRLAALLINIFAKESMGDTLRIELAGYLGFKLDPLDCENNAALIERLVDFFKPKPGSQTPGILPEEFIYNLFCISYKYHKTLPNVVRVNRHHFRINNDASRGDLTVVGDLHGQYSDFAQIFQNPKLGGYPSETNRFIFNGDMVYRGPMGLEIMVVLMFCNIIYSQSVHILRGNHETRSTTAKYGFKKEVVNPLMYKLFMIFFDTLPVAAIVDNVVFVTHGGIGPAVANLTIEELEKVNRVGEVAFNTVIGDLLWAGNLYFYML